MQFRIPKSLAASSLTLLLTIITTLIHSACCILPILAAILPGKILPNLFPGYLVESAALFQYAALAYLIVRFSLDQLGIWRLHSLVERFGYVIAVVVTVGGIAFGHRRTEVQQLTEARLEMVRKHAQVSIKLSKSFPNEQLSQYLMKLDGVSRSAIDIRQDKLKIFYRRREVTEAQIFTHLRNIGYPVLKVE